ncbi:MAG: CDP-diacylglycerol--serine O-phosphatidyltransferase, partial [Bdellovibrionales bacterium]|nr:CDP-diacylglycerol--serine O-phosphatidyltransferase [Bdellovibrionales bacterium]
TFSSAGSIETMKEKNARNNQKLTRLELKDRLYRRRYVIPNLVTLANMFCGFLTIIYASSDRFEKAAVAIGIAILLDGLDGRVARRLNATSPFGVEFDSFSDLVSFGIAPSLLMYFWCFQQLADEFGVLVCFLFALSAAGRLARFNIETKTISSFSGLPTPGAAALVAAVVHFFPRVEQTYGAVAVGTVLALSLAVLMISQIQFFSVKRLKMNNVHLPALVFFGAAIALVWYHSGIGFFTIALLYVLSGPLGALKRKMKRNRSPLEEQARITQKKLVG